MKHITRLYFFALIAALPFSASASCGSAFCPINTQWDVQGVWTEPGLRLDLRYEYIPQKQPKNGSHSIDVGEIPRHHDEVETINHNLLATLDYTFNSHWGASLSIPVVNRSHKHIHNHHGDKLLDKWNLTDVGDIKVAGRYQQSFRKLSAIGIIYGAKLPTGDYNASNNEGDLAERSLQPGTGTTDFLIGPYARLDINKDSSFFTQLLFTKPFKERAGYKAGEQVTFDIGYRHALTPHLSGLTQLNFHYKGKDSGQAAEADDSGNRSIHFSPGLSYSLTKNSMLYGYVQIPLYQHVNGIQLTEKWSAVSGVSFRF